MKNKGLTAGLNIWMRSMDLMFSADTIDKIFIFLRSIPKERLEEESIRLWEKMDREDITEEQVLALIEA